MIDADFKEIFTAIVDKYDYEYQITDEDIAYAMILSGDVKVDDDMFITVNSHAEYIRCIGYIDLEHLVVHDITVDMCGYIPPRMQPETINRRHRYFTIYAQIFKLVERMMNIDDINSDTALFNLEEAWISGSINHKKAIDVQLRDSEELNRFIETFYNGGR